MSKQNKTIKEILAVHTEKLDTMCKLLDDHVKESIDVRDEVIHTKTNVTWLRRGIIGLYGIIAGIITWIVSTALAK